jgi:transposase
MRGSPLGACAATLAPLIELIRRHVMQAERLHGDDTTMPVLAKNRTVIGLWTYVRDNRRFGGTDPPAALFHYSRYRGGEHPKRHLLGGRNHLLVLVRGAFCSGAD